MANMPSNPYFDRVKADNFTQSLKMAIKALEEIQQYRAIGTVEECKIYREACEVLHLEQLSEYRELGTVEEFQEERERQMPKKYKKIHPCKSVTYYQCPCCNELLHINENFCGECGQAIDWEDLD